MTISKSNGVVSINKQSMDTFSAATSIYYIVEASIELNEPLNSLYLTYGDFDKKKALNLNTIANSKLKMSIQIQTCNNLGKICFHLFTFIFLHSLFLSLPRASPLSKH